MPSLWLLEPLVPLMPLLGLVQAWGFPVVFLVGPIDQVQQFLLVL